MDKYQEWNNVLETIKKEEYHYENHAGLANSRENAKKFRIASIEELIQWEKEKDKQILEQALKLNL